MPVLAKDDGKKYEPIPTGPQQAACAFAIDLGTHESDFMGVTRNRHKCVLIFELAETITSGERAGEPFMLSKTYTLSLNEKASLRKELESWRGKAFTPEELQNGFDLERLIGANCYLNIVDYKKQNGDTGQKIGAIMPLPKNIPPMPVINKQPPQWVQGEIANSIEYRESNPDIDISQGDEDDLPF